MMHDEVEKEEDNDEDEVEDEHVSDESDARSEWRESLAASIASLESHERRLQQSVVTLDTKVRHWTRDDRLS